MSSLADFLLDRVRDDLAAGEWHRGDCDALCDMYACSCEGAARLAVECEVKCRLIAPHVGGHRCAWGDWYQPGECEAEVLKLLALPYSTHPDYDEEWSA